MFEHVDESDVSNELLLGTGISIPPGPGKMSLENLMFFLKRNMRSNLAALADKYGVIFQIYIGGNRRVFVLNGIETVREALVQQSENFSAQAGFEICREKVQDNFVELSNSEEWDKYQGVIYKAMHNFLSLRWDVIEEWLRVEANELSNELMRSSGIPFNPGLAIALGNYSFVQKIIFGRRCNDFDKSMFHEQDLELLSTGFMDSVRYSIIPWWLKPFILLQRKRKMLRLNKVMDKLRHYMSVNIDEHRAILDIENPRDITDYLLMASYELSEIDKRSLDLGEEGLVNRALTQFAGISAGMPTFAMRLALHYMILYPEIQSHVQDELDRVVGRGALPCYTDRTKLPFTQACIHEVLRHSSITPMTAIHYVATNDTSISNYYIPKDSPVIVNNYSVTRDSSVWNEVDAFDPKRFINYDGSIRKDLTSKFYPFSLGPRRCLAENLARMQMFLLFTHLLHKFRFEKVPDEERSVDCLRGMFPVPGNFRVIAHPRT